MRYPGDGTLIQKNPDCSGFFCMSVSRRYIFSAEKITEAGSRKFQFDGIEIIRDQDKLFTKILNKSVLFPVTVQYAPLLSNGNSNIP